MAYSPPLSPSSSSARSPSQSRAPPPRLPLSPPPRSPIVGDVGFYGYHFITSKRNHTERIRAQRNQGTSLHAFDLTPHADEILRPSGVSRLQSLIDDLVRSPAEKPGIKKVLDSLELHYPNSFSLKLAGLLCTQPPSHVRNEVVSTLHRIFVLTYVFSNQGISCTTLVGLKKPLLESIKNESDEDLLPLLCKTICSVASRIYDYHFRIAGWKELLGYISECFRNGASELQKLKGMALLADLSIECVDHDSVWLEANYSELSAGFLASVDSPSEKLQALTFEAAWILAGMAKPLGRIEIGAQILSVMLKYIDRHKEDEVVLCRVQRLAVLVASELADIVKDKEGEMFWCMLRIAERWDASEELRRDAAAILACEQLVLESTVITHLSPVDAERVLALAMDLLLCVKDDNVWYDVDSGEAGISESFENGGYILNWICFDGDGSVVVPTLIKMVTTEFSGSTDWRKRHAGMIAISAIVEGQKKTMVQYFDQVQRLLLVSLNDQHPRVLWAAMDAISSLSAYKELLQNAQYHMKFLAKLVSIIRCRSDCSRVQGQAAIAIRLLVKNCGLDKMEAFGEDIVTALLQVLVKSKKPKVLEEAVETLNSVVVLMRTKFCNYKATMELLKAIVKDYNTMRLSLFAKSLQCMSCIILRREQKLLDEQVAVQQDAVLVVESIASLEGKLSITDHSIKCHILKALDQLCRSPQVIMDGLVVKVMPMLLQSGRVDFDLTNASLNDDEKSLVKTERLLACNILSYMSVQRSLRFPEHTEQVVNIFARWIRWPIFETQKAAILALPNLLFSIKSGVKDEKHQRGFSNFTVKCLVEALQKETDDDQFIRMLKSLSKCIQISGSLLYPRIIKMIADEINRTIFKLPSKIIEMERAPVKETSTGGSGYSKDEEIIRNANQLVGTTIRTFRAQFLPFVDNLMFTVAVLWGDSFTDRVKAVAVSLFNVIVLQLPHKLQMFYDHYTPVVLKCFRDEIPNAQLEAVRGIGLCAMFGGDRFKSIANEAISILYHEILKRLSGSGGSDADAMVYDMAVSALGKICDFHRGSIVGHEVIAAWLSFLPLKSDHKEAKYAHAQLCKMIRRSDVDLLGPNNENLPKIIAVLREILSLSADLATKDSITQIVDFLNQHGAMP